MNATLAAKNLEAPGTDYFAAWAFGDLKLRQARLEVRDRQVHGFPNGFERRQIIHCCAADFII
jgi:hypothetical protein